MPKVYLLTGKPGMGKTSIIKQLAAEFRSRAGGFYTEELRSQGVRLGFKLVTLDGEEAVLSHVDFSKKYRVGKYGVDIESLERVGVSALERAAGDCEIVIVDEIGKMELLSARFRETVNRIIASGKMVMGTIMLDSNPFADAIKRQPQVKLLALTRANYSEILNELSNWLKKPLD